MQQPAQQPAHQNPIQIGHATFAPTITKPTLKKLLKSKREKILHEDTWMISSQSSSSQWSDIFPLMTTATNLHLRLITGLLRQTVFLQISHIRFLNLQQLNLLNNQITTVEAILYLNCPQLEKVCISINRLSIVSNFLCKIYFPKLCLIDCSDNYFSEANLGRFLVKSKEMKIFLFRELKLVCAVEDISIFAKCPSCNWSKWLQFLTAYKKSHLNYLVKNIAQCRSAQAMIRKFKQTEISKQPINV